MKKQIVLALACLCVSGCVNNEKHLSDWKPTPYHVPVECCMEAEQVQGAIRTALIKRNWTVLDVEDNKVYAHISCGWTDADVIFSTTDKYYDINFENIMEEEYNDHDCLYRKTDDINYVVGRYLTKISRKNAKLEMKAANRATKQKYSESK